ncbi:hypothetical protein PFICI_07504 [Pestalotiopsis fici W106-1]|uniref:Xylanolytic transcriptional activator regulatory domain-containing protein n=1 Tax=Pestalotiopsis fici (strain W106-1 / CGMCC3.15140) TaxID=1229662 RepID=W3X1M3_PESFW|nr:uncharacterized protein PFICI_07504 [Pestalotiopsis fici W106-1]ETS79975.1 hypothetical protein PFICI_07504 [Pestalotiopsis fici W106-1]
MQSCKSLSQRLQQKRQIPWVHGEYGTCLPSKETADILIDKYLRTFETVQRILHVPTFRREYRMFWENQSQAPFDFLIKMQLCFSLGACLYDDIFSLRPQALQWIREASAWTESFDSPNLSISGVQIMCLLSLAQNVVQELIGDRTWIRSGALIRLAMAIGLHRDPTKLPSMPAAQGEMRRRLWTTVLELALSSCLDAGGTLLISLRDFDCMLPMNLDDTQLDFDDNGDLLASDSATYTDTTLQIALAQTFPARLAIAEYANGFNSEQSYDKTLRLAADLKSATTRFGESIKVHHAKITDFQRRYYEMVMDRYMFMLHIPYATVALKDSAFLLSRDTCVDAALRLSYAALDSRLMPDAFLDSARAAMVVTAPCQDYVRLVLCGAGLFRATQTQALMIIAAELHARLVNWSEGACLDTTGPLGTLRGQELLSFLRVGVEWTKCRILAGQDNIKDYVFQAAILAGITAMIEGGSVKEATDNEGKEACIKAKALLVNLVGDDEPSNTGQAGVAEDSWNFHANDFWTADWADCTGSFVIPQ